MPRRLLLGVLFLSGCAAAPELEGDVTLDGKPLERGSLLLVPTGSNAGQVVSATIENGKFRLAGKHAPTPGVYRVEVRASRKTGRKVRSPFGKPGERVDEMTEAVAPRFNRATELTVEVKGGKEAVRFEVRSR